MKENKHAEQQKANKEKAARQKAYGNNLKRSVLSKQKNNQNAASSSSRSISILDDKLVTVQDAAHRGAKPQNKKLVVSYSARGVGTGTGRGGRLGPKVARKHAVLADI